MSEDDTAGTATTLSCPQCGHLLALHADSGQASFACPGGHRFTLQALLAAQGATALSLLQAGLVFFEQQAHLLQELTEQVWRSQPLVALQLDGYHDQIEDRISKLRAVLDEAPPDRRADGGPGMN